MEMKTRLLLVPFLLVTATALAAGCGGGSGSVSADSVAKVGSTSITKTKFSDLMQVGLANYLAHGQKPPQVGTPLYTQLKAQAVTFLVQQEELKQEGQKLGVTVTQKEIDAKLAATRTTYFHGSQKKLEAELKKDHVTLAQYEQYQILPTLLGQMIYDKVTSNVNVSKADAKKYYDQNQATYTTQAETTRSVRHILVNSKTLADKLETQLKNGANFAKLAKKYSRDTGSAQLGGKLTAIKGQLVKPFQDVAFSLKTNEISKPVKSQYGWHIIQALGPIQNKPAHVTPFSQVEAQIQSNLATQKKGTVWSTWLAKLKKDYEGKVSYQTGYAPATTTVPTAPTTTG
jgi:foldase protein PrsA